MAAARPQKLTADFLHFPSTNTTMTTDPYLGSSLHKFLEERRIPVRQGKEVSMTGMGTGKGGCWMVSDDDYPKFFDLMNDFLHVKRYMTNNFVEQRKTDGITPLLVDLDFRYPGEKNLQRTFTTDHIQSFVSEIVAVLKEWFELKDRTPLRFFVTLRPQPYLDRGKKEIKDGVHIVCPDFVVSPDNHAFIRMKLLERNAVSTCFEGTEYTNRDTDVFDESLVKKNGWFFYGESKPGIPAYMLEVCYKYTPRTGKLSVDNTTYSTRELLELLSIRYNRKPLLVALTGKQEEIAEALATHRAPIVQTGHTEHQESSTHAAMEGILPVLIDSFNTTIITEDEVALAKRLALECLSGARAEGYDSWMRVGWCLRNISATDDMFDVWMKFSEKSAKCTGNNVDQLRRDWERGSMRRVNGSPGLRMGSLKMWAKEDSPAVFQSIMDGDIISFIQKTAITFKGGTHHHVALMIQKLFPDIYKCHVEGRTTEWYKFQGHIWKKMPNSLMVRCTLNDVVEKKIDDARAALRPPAENDPEYQDKYDKFMENKGKMLDMQRNLYNATFKDSVMKEASQLFNDNNFMKNVNQNAYTLGCANGVLHLRETVFDDSGKPVRYRVALHPGTAEDYITLQSGEDVNYYPYDPKDPAQEEIKDFFTKLFPAEDLREYVLTLMAGCLEGCNKEQCFYLMTGSGGNGKSKFVDLMTGVLGDYAGSLATTALTRKRPDSSSANPDIMSVKGCRFIEMKEPDEGEPINSARMKQFSGEDYVEARGLFKDQEKFKITGKIFMACNRMPPIHSMDGGTWRRIRVIPFNSRFVPRGEPIDPENHVYPRDDMMDEKIKRWREPFLALLVHYYETKYCPHGIIKTPSTVMQASENYKGNFDLFGKFIKARVRKVAGYDSPPTFKDFKKAFRNWKNEEAPNGKNLTDVELRIRLNETYQTPADKKETYKNLRLFYSDEELEEYEQEQAALNAAMN